MSTPVRLQIVIPFHQPLRAGERELAAACDDCYAPLVEAIAGRPRVKAAVHFGGHLLDFLAKSRESLLLRIRALVKSGQLEALGGLFYSGAPALLPELDTSGQIQMASEFWESYLGAAPRGFWLNDLAWCVELPRLLEDAGLEYGFASQSQLVLPAGGHRGLVTLARGERRLGAFVLDDGLSAALPSRPAEEWLAALSDRGADLQGGERLTSVWVRAESLGLEPGTHGWVWRDGWLNQWLDGLQSRDDLDLVLPAQSFESCRPAGAAGIVEAIAPELAPLLDGQGSVRWDDFSRVLPEARLMHQRMLKVSDKLRDAISTMEDDGLERDWSDSLATAQRLVFAAQASDVYWRGATPGVTDPLLRDAVHARLSEAEQMIDTLVQGDDDWIAMEEDDHDGDGVEEVFVTTAHLGLWLSPRLGGTIHTLDWRAFGTCLFDVGMRRPEAFFADLGAAPRRARTDATAPAKRGSQLARLSDELPTTIDRQAHLGAGLVIFDQRTTSAELFSGSATSLVPGLPRWEVTRSEIDDQGDYAYHAELKTELDLAGVHPRRALVERRLVVPIDAPALELLTQVRLEGGPEIVVGVELPIRMGSAALQIAADGNDVPGASRELHDVRVVELKNADGQLVRLRSEKPFDLWLEPVTRTLRDLAGYERVEEGVLLIPTLTVASEGALALRLELGAASESAAPAEDDSSAE